MTGKLENWNAVISGGATGAGGAGSEVFAAEGAHVAIVDKNIEAAVETARRIEKTGGKAFSVEADVSDADQVATASKQVLERFEGRIDTLWNHAGTVIVKDFLHTTETEWDWMMAVNVTASASAAVPSAVTSCRVRFPDARLSSATNSPAVAWRSSGRGATARLIAARTAGRTSRNLCPIAGAPSSFLA